MRIGLAVLGRREGVGTGHQGYSPCDPRQAECAEGIGTTIQSVEVPGAPGHPQPVGLDDAGAGRAGGGRCVVEGHNAALIDGSGQQSRDLLAGEIGREVHQGILTGVIVDNGTDLGQGVPGGGGQLPRAPGGGRQGDGRRLLGGQGDVGQGVIVFGDGIAALLALAGSSDRNAEIAQNSLVPFEHAASGLASAPVITAHGGHHLRRRHARGGVAQGQQQVDLPLFGGNRLAGCACHDHSVGAQGARHSPQRPSAPPAIPSTGTVRP